LTQAQLAEAETFALKYGLALPSPLNPSAREMQLTTLWHNMRSAAVAQPSVAGDALADAETSTPHDPVLGSGKQAIRRALFGGEKGNATEKRAPHPGEVPWHGPTKG
jgi:hypothetical protein